MEDIGKGYVDLGEEGTRLNLPEISSSGYLQISSSGADTGLGHTISSPCNVMSHEGGGGRPPS